MIESIYLKIAKEIVDHRRCSSRYPKKELSELKQLVELLDDGSFLCKYQSDFLHSCLECDIDELISNPEYDLRRF